MSDLARRLRLKTPTVHNLARTFLATGYLVKDAEARYHLGPAVDALASRGGRARRMRAVEAAMRALAAREPACVLHFSRPSGIDMLEVRYWDPRTRTLGQREWTTHHPYGSASGLAGQAYADPATLAELRQRYPFPEHGAHLWGTLARLDAFLDEVRGRRLCIPAHVGASLYLVAVPILDHHLFTGVLGAALPLADAADDAIRARIAAHVTQAVAEVTAAHA